ncbi:MAG: gluconate 2-dehydrogenase subunit 3 family protein [Xanthomonadales bacterium]|nr:gluconate 2-dehydrogenase subunit 3 family protein [Xanthomonadales bacterium]MDH4020933.1 gluconate 2-dehydrogenase subunit 3 family protein [Xanthomonadales bacterium]
MINSRNSRRKFLKSSGSVLGASWLAVNMPLVVSASQTAAKNKEAGAGFENLSAKEAVELSAIVDQIIPADETPGASEAGVVYFIDVALGSFMSDAAPRLRQGLEELQHKTKSAYPDSIRFSELPFEQQTEILKSVENTPMFAMLHLMTLFGMFCLPSYGGNRDNSGWNLIGFDHRHAWQPPFGYYDTDVHGQLPAGGDDHEHI